MTAAAPSGATYFLYNERLAEPLIKTQVFNLLEDLNAEAPHHPLSVVVFQNPATYWLERAQRRKALSDIDPARLKVSVFPFALPTRGFWSSRLGVRLHQWLFQMTGALLPGGAVVTRGYLSSYLCSMHRTGSRWRVIADPRSLYVRENIGTRWSLESDQYLLWRDIERAWLDRSHHVFVVNKAMAAHYRELHPQAAAKISCVPIYTRQTALGSSPGRNAQGTPIRLIYVGSLSASKWNDAQAYARFFKALIPFRQCFQLTLIVKEKNAEVAALTASLDEWGIDHEVHVNLPPAEVQNHMARAQVGLLISEAWDDAGARTGVKTIEYLANALALWVTRPLAEVATLVDRHQLGHVFESTTPMAQDIESAINAYRARHADMHAAASAYYQRELSPGFVRQLVRHAIDGTAWTSSRASP